MQQDPHVVVLQQDPTLKARGVKFLQSRNIYVLAVFLAMFLYQCDRWYDLRQVICSVTSTVSRLVADDVNEDILIDAKWVLLCSLLILSVVITVKRIETNKAKEEALEQAEDEPAAIIPRNHACERISQEEFEYETAVTSRKEIVKLVNSEEYKAAMKEKGADLSLWNWQVYDKAQGIFPGDEPKDDEDFDLVEEIEKADLQVGLAKRPASRITREKQESLKSLQSRTIEKDINGTLSPNGKITQHEKTPSTLSSVKRYQVTPTGQKN